MDRDVTAVRSALLQFPRIREEELDTARKYFVQLWGVAMARLLTVSYGEVELQQQRGDF